MKIGVFDSGYGGLTILNAMRQQLPQYDYLYLGDNARAPYGTRSFDVIYAYTLQAVKWLLEQDCALVILACNTASAKALRTIQQCDLPQLRKENGNWHMANVLGVIRPTVEAVPALTKNGHIGILATPATVSSQSYVLELEKMPIVNCQLSITQQACPMWVPLIEAGEHWNSGADYFVAKYLDELFAADPLIDTIILGCTHYPLIAGKIRTYLETKNLKPETIYQGDIVARSLADYLRRHQEFAPVLSQNGTCCFATTEAPDKFQDNAALFLQTPIHAQHVAF